MGWLLNEFFYELSSSLFFDCPEPCAGVVVGSLQFILLDNEINCQAVYIYRLFSLLAVYIYEITA